MRLPVLVIVLTLPPFKAGVLRPSGSQPSNSPTIQRATKTAAMPQVPQPAPGHSVQPMAKPIAPEVSKTSVVGGRNEDDPCVICHEDMNATNNIVTLECGHRYHSAVRLFNPFWGGVVYS